MYEDKDEVSIKIVNFNPKEETIITYEKEDSYLTIDDALSRHGIVTFHCPIQDLQRIVDMLNYVIKLNQNATTNPG